MEMAQVMIHCPQNQKNKIYVSEIQTILLLTVE